MKKLITILLFMSLGFAVAAQAVVTIEGKDTTITGAGGYAITRTSAILLRFLNNIVLYTYTEDPIVNCGTNDYTIGQSTNLNDAVIKGNRVTWTSATETGSTHGLMAGYNTGYDIAYNYIDSTQYGVTHEGGYPNHTSMDNSTGGIYYNIFKNNNFSVIEKGYAGTRIYNNTFYTNKNEFSTFIGIKESDTGGITEPYPVTSGTKVFNNIFYNDGTTAFHAISVGEATDDTPEEMDTVGLEIDYNIYFYENSANNEPTFEFNGDSKTWTEWRALGYDEHSVILDPQFVDFIDLVPASKDLIDIGTNLGTEFDDGLSTTATWVAGVTPTTEVQGDLWQVGARVYETDVIYSATYYVSTTGSDDNPGTYALPWATWGEAFNSASVQPGDTVYFRGGVYSMTSDNLAYPYSEGSGYNVGRDGTIGDTIRYWAYPGETPILDCDNISLASGSNRGINGNDINYVHFKGLTVRNVNQSAAGNSTYGWIINGDNLKVENCEVYNTGGRGFYSTGHEVYYLNCDSHHNCDSLTAALPGNDGVGFQNTDLTNADGSIYYWNCRAWMNGDQGFSAVSIGYLEFDGCWSFNNGLYQGEGHGFKMGAVGLEGEQPEFGPLKRKYTNNVAAFNRANGWTTNDNTSYLARTMYVYNNIAYHNGYPTGWGGLAAGFVIYNTASIDAEELDRTYHNNIAYGNEDGDTFIPAGALYTHSNNSWDLSVTVSDADFVSVDSTGITAARQADGSLPANDCFTDFLQLATGSELIDVGVNVSIPYNGVAPDLGPFETTDAGTPTSITPLKYGNKFLKSGEIFLKR